MVCTCGFHVVLPEWAGEYPMKLTHLHDPIEDLDLDRYLAKMASRNPDEWNPERLQLAAREYKRFLRLRQLHPTVAMVPTELMDAVWHEHILNTRAYEIEMQRIFGTMLHHCPVYEEEPAPGPGLELTVALYKAAFAETPMEVTAARCQGKACHAPTSCRCR